MQRVEEPPTETIHLYVVREKEPKPSLFPIILSIVALVCVVAVGVLSPYQQPVIRAVLRTPAVLLPRQTFTAEARVVPTGNKTIPATIAHGYLTITNGSVISQDLPSGIIFTGNAGISVVTDTSVFVPAGSANGYGYVTVTAHAVLPGKKGNILPRSIDVVEGSSLYIRNLVAFSGGADAYSVRFITSQDRQTALEQARQRLLQQSVSLHYPCKEVSNGYSRSLTVTWVCQFVTYHIPAFYHVTGVRISGKNLLVDVWFVGRPMRFETK